MRRSLGKFEQENQLINKYMDEEFRVSAHVSDQEDNEIDKKS